MTWFWLRILDLLRPVYKWQGVDFDQLRAIVYIKLEMDNRRAPAFKMQQQQSEHSYAFALILFLYSIFGAFLAALIAYVPSVIFSFTIYHLYVMIMITLTLVSDFSAVLLDTSDNTIVLPRPITPKTFYAARTTHILIYIGQIGFGLAAIPIIVTFFKFGAAVGIAVIVTSILSIVFAVGLTSGLYLLLMRFTSEERLKSIINYFQIGMAIFMMGAYQILPRIIGIQDLTNVTTDLQWWSVFIPPMWMAGAIKIVTDFNLDGIYLVSALLAVVVPVVSWRAINKYLTPYFTTKLADLGTGSAPVVAANQKTKSTLSSAAHWITKDGLERAAFSIVSYAFSRDRKLKLRIYPSLGYFVVMIFIFMFRGGGKDQPLMQTLESLPNGEAHLFIIYACIFIFITVSQEIHFSDDFKSAWVYLSAPIKRPGEILSGSLKAIFIRIFLPLYSIATVIVLIIWREKAIVDLVFGALTSVLLMIIISIVAEKHLPFSLAPTARNKGASFARAIVSMIIIALVSFGHYFLTSLDILLWLACPVMLVACYFLLRLYRSVEWEEIKI